MNESERRFIIKSISENIPTREIAQALDRKPSTFWSYLRRNNIRVKDIRRRVGLMDPWASSIPEIVNMLRELHSTDQIARHFKVTPAQLRGIVGRYGVSMNIERSKGRRNIPK